MNIIKKISVIYIAIFLFIGIFVNFVNASSDTAYDIGEYIIDATVMKDGNLHVIEKIRFDFDESANGIYRDILYKYNFSNQKDDMIATSSRYQASNVYNIAISETDCNYENSTYYTNIDESNAINGMKNVFSISNLLNDGYQKRNKVNNYR